MASDRVRKPILWPVLLVAALAGGYWLWFVQQAFLPVVLWTDALVFLLVGAVVVFVRVARRQEHLRAPWRRVLASRPGMAGLTVLAVFVLIGVLDSLHFRLALPEQPALAAHAAPGAERGGEAPRRAYAVEVLSVLDLLCEPLRARRERTYSAPLAAYLYQMETVTRADGTPAREFPRLRYGGAHLADPATELAADVARRAALGAASATGLWLLAVAFVVVLLARRWRMSFTATLRQVACGHTETAWNSVLITLGVIALAAGPIVALSGTYHVFGTAKVGESVLYEVLKSIRTGLVIGTLTTTVTLPFALLGVVAGYCKGWVDDAIQYVYTTLSSIPDVLLIAAAVLMMQVYIEANAAMFTTAAERADFRLLVLCLILGVTSWTGLCRLLRGETLKLRELEYIQAAQAFGVPGLRIILRHILPNVMHIVLISVVMAFSGLVLAEAVLSYVGVGVDPSMISFGTMINDARFEMAREPVVWWALAAAFVFMLLLVLAANLFADAVRDAFDPRLALLRPRRPLPGAAAA